MRDSGIFSRAWFVGVVAAWAFILILDEVAYYWWKNLNPGSTWSGVLVKHPPTINETGGQGIPNGYRPAGGP